MRPYSRAASTPSTAASTATVDPRKARKAQQAAQGGNGAGGGEAKREDPASVAGDQRADSVKTSSSEAKEESYKTLTHQYAQPDPAFPASVTHLSFLFSLDWQQMRQLRQEFSVRCEACAPKPVTALKWSAFNPFSTASDLTLPRPPLASITTARNAGKYSPLTASQTLRGGADAVVDNYSAKLRMASCDKNLDAWAGYLDEDDEDDDNVGPSTASTSAAQPKPKPKTSNGFYSDSDDSNSADVQAEEDEDEAWRARKKLKLEAEEERKRREAEEKERRKTFDPAKAYGLDQVEAQRSNAQGADSGGYAGYGGHGAGGTGMQQAVYDDDYDSE
ncbi:hypothetical protein JCM11641_005508 [Rhodosporidiobolus odoratus]